MKSLEMLSIDRTYVLISDCDNKKSFWVHLWYWIFDNLSPILFALSIEPLLMSLSTSRFHFHRSLDMCQAFADDTTIFAKGTSHLEEIVGTISHYKKASNVKANLEKSIFIPLNNKAKDLMTTSNLTKTFKTGHPSEGITILGYRFTLDMKMHQTI